MATAKKKSVRKPATAVRRKKVGRKPASKPRFRVPEEPADELIDIAEIAASAAFGEIIRSPRRFVTSTRDQIPILFSSDQHLGAQEVDWGLLRSDFEWARRVAARILLIGDLFDAIFSKDKRSTPSTVDRRLANIDAQLNGAIDIAFDFLKDYVDLIDVIGYGNHETAVLKYGAADIVALLQERLQVEANRVAPGHRIRRTGYTGAYVIPISMKCPNSTGKTANFIIWFHHGMANAAPVTKGMIAFNRAATYVQGAHVLWMGHLHVRWVAESAAIFIPQHGARFARRPVKHIMTGAYTGGKAQFDAGGNYNLSWATEKGFAPQGKGGVRAYISVRDDRSFNITCEV